MNAAAATVPPTIHAVTPSLGSSLTVTPTSATPTAATTLPPPAAASASTAPTAAHENIKVATTISRNHTLAPTVAGSTSGAPTQPDTKIPEDEGVKVTADVHEDGTDSTNFVLHYEDNNTGKFH